LASIVASMPNDSSRARAKASRKGDGSSTTRTGSRSRDSVPGSTHRAYVRRAQARRSRASPGDLPSITGKVRRIAL
jgi:hypothetical protein